MALSDHYNATFTLQRKTRSGSDDGTPIYTESPVVVSGWWDEIEVRTIDEPIRDQEISFTDRRALFMCDAGSNIQQDDEGVVDVSGFARGVWQVSRIAAAPIPGGVGQLEIQMQGVKESV